MSKVAVQLSKRSQVKNHKIRIQEQQQKKAKDLHAEIMKKIQQHNKKRQKQYKKKVSHFKLLDENWKFKMQQIQRKKQQQNQRSLQKAEQYRKQIQSYWSAHSKTRKRQNQIPVVQQEGYFTIKQQQSTKEQKNQKYKQFFLSKRKSMSKNEIPNKSFLPNIQMKSPKSILTNQKIIEQKIKQHKSLNKLQKQKYTSQILPIQKSKLIINQKQEANLQRALQKLKKIQIRRKKCKQQLQKSLNEAKLKRQIRQNPQMKAQKRRIIQKQASNKKRDRFPIESMKNINQTYSNNKIQANLSMNLNRLSLDQTIFQHKRAKEQLEEQQFMQRNQVLKANLTKQKKGKMMKMAKELINQLKIQTLKECI